MDNSQISRFLKDPGQSWIGFFIELIVLLALVLFIRFYVFQLFQVSGPSMCPTLNVFDTACESESGEFVFVNEFSYKFLRDPKRGEVVVFRPPSNITPNLKDNILNIFRPSHKDKNKQEYYIKRVIGLPGDTVNIRDGQVYINNNYIEDYQLNESYLSVRNQGRTQASVVTFDVPEGKYLLFGDNRDQSLDARQCFGSCRNIDRAYVEKENIRGTAEFVIWPPKHFRWLDNMLKEDNPDLFQAKPGEIVTKTQ